MISAGCTLDLSTDEGKSWQPLPLPNISAWQPLIVSNNAPWNLFLGADDEQGNSHLFYSHDAGHRWQQFDIYPGVTVTPYLPLSVIGVRDNHLYVLDLSDSTSELTVPVQPTAPSDPSKPPAFPLNYFPATGHNLSPLFSSYWQQHGGMAQQGMPITEALREVSDNDGKVYAVQYFERAVFEMHPENQPPYNVLLSLLGADAYKQKYGSAGAPNQHVSTDDPLYFSQTGHTIGGRFRQYWEDHGGLAQQGYPISDEFTEVSALDDKPYTVQYFQRAEFEYHPENQAPNDVLLSQLGTLKAKQLGTQVVPPAPGPTASSSPLSSPGSSLSVNVLSFGSAGSAIIAATSNGPIVKVAVPQGK
jgi:hypothetical protein